MEQVLELRTRQVGPWNMNTYALVCPATRHSVLIDPGADPNALEELLADTLPQAIWVTHHHGDHIGALDDMRDRLGVPVLAHPASDFGNMARPADAPLADGDRLEVGEHVVRVVHTPGHTAGQVCFALWGASGTDDPRAVVGDTIFEGGPGKTWSAQDFRATLQTLREVILSWPDDAVCHPGHGPAFRLGDSRAAIEAFLSKDHGDFFGDATWDM